MHGHFYQPPRQDPFTGRIPPEEGAEPYANWNERINAECYRPNAILGNFQRLSFDIGPTLASWLAEADPDTYRRIVASDGGNAMAQAYNHTILPLMPRRDKETQVRWGIADFRHRFRRDPVGMWLPETAADRETLDVLAAEGIRYTILAPWQALPDGVDSGRPWRVRVSDGRDIAVFFFDALLSNNVSFNPRATESATAFVRDYLVPWRDHRPPGDARPPIILIASDGELYGHHQRGREHFLHDLLFGIAESRGFPVVTLQSYLDRYPPVDEVAVRDGTSWSCHHGVARWSEGCACTEGDSAWKGVVFTALRRLAQRLDEIAEEATGPFVDFWAARDAYVAVVLGVADAKDLLAGFARRRLTSDEERRALLLLEAHYYGQWMFTSCGFFWDDLSRLEVQNNLAYAARAMDLVERATGHRLDEAFARDLATARSGRTGERGDAMFRRIWAAREAVSSGHR